MENMSAWNTLRVAMDSFQPANQTAAAVLHKAASLSIFRARLNFKRQTSRAENTAFSGQDYILWHLKESTSHLFPICHSRCLREQKLLPPLILGGKSNFASCHAKNTICN